MQKLIVPQKIGFYSLYDTLINSSRKNDGEEENHENERTKLQPAI